MATRGDNRNTRSAGDKGGRSGSSPPDGRRGGERRGSDTRSQRSGASGGSGSRGSASNPERRSPRTPQSRDSTGQPRNRPKSADGSFRGSYYSSQRGDGLSPTSPTGGNPLHQVQRDVNQYAMNSPPTTGGRLPNGRLLSGTAPDGMLHHPRCGTSRTQFGGIWEDHKCTERPVQVPSGTRTGFSEFGDAEQTDTSTYQNHFGTFFDGDDTMSHVKPNIVGTATATRGVNGYGRNANGGFTMREKLGDMRRYKHADSWRGMPAWARKIPEPTRPGPGYTRTDQGGYFRT